MPSRVTTDIAPAMASSPDSLQHNGSGGPPSDSPLTWVVAAVARRDIVTPTSAGMPVTAVPPATNTAPVFGTPSVRTPSTSTGKVSGKVSATDTDRDRLAYAVSGLAAKGSVKITASSGAFTYTPTAAARHAASRVGAPGAAKVDTFVVTVTDRRGATATQTVTVTVAPKNSVPKVSVSVGKPDSTTGVVSGKATATDSDKDAVTFSAPATTAKGVVVIDARTGAFTYTPTQAARVAAGTKGASSAAKKDTFDIAVSDGYGGTATKSVSVAIAAASATVDRLPPAPVGAQSLLSKIPNTPNTIYAERYVREGITRMVVYMSGIPGTFSWNSEVGAAQTNITGRPLKAVTDYIDAQVEAWKPGAIMLVGYSNGGQQMQAYAATGKYSQSVIQVVTYASPIIKKQHEYSSRFRSTTSQGAGISVGTHVLHFKAENDPVNNFDHGDAVESFQQLGLAITGAYSGSWDDSISYGGIISEEFLAARMIYRIPGDDELSVLDRHGLANYAKAAKSFDAYAEANPLWFTSGNFAGSFHEAAYEMRNRISAFTGTLTTSARKTVL